MQFDVIHDGVAGLIVLAFTDSFISPIMPEVLFLPLSLANRDMAIYYSLIATAASVVGAIVGYGMGAKLGPVCITRFVPEKYWLKIMSLVEKYGKWALFWGALSPMPYKFVSISAGVLKIDSKAFVLITIIGRLKRYLIEGILLYYFGGAVVDFFQRSLIHYPLYLAGAVILGGLAYWLFKKNSILAN